jgi:hypothetical protein
LPKNTHDADQSGAKSGALSSNLSPELQELINHWQTLPEALKAGILAMVRSVPE